MQAEKEQFANDHSYKITLTNKQFGVSPFFIPLGPQPIPPLQFSLEAPTTSNNVMRVLRAMQLPRAILLGLLLLVCEISFWRLFQ